MKLSRVQRNALVFSLIFCTVASYFIFHTAENFAVSTPTYPDPIPASVWAAGGDAGDQPDSMTPLPGSLGRLYTPTEHHTWKTILFWDKWFGGDWSNRFGPASSWGLEGESCPTWRCRFTYDRSLLHGAHAVLFRALAVPAASVCVAVVVLRAAVWSVGPDGHPQLRGWPSKLEFGSHFSLWCRACVGFRTLSSSFRQEVGPQDVVRGCGRICIGYPWEALPKHREPEEQRWVLVDVEAPPEGPPASTLRSRQASSLINWTMTYHSQSDVVAYNGYFLSYGASVRPLRPNRMRDHTTAVARVKEALTRGATLEEVLGLSWRSYVNKPRVVAWMSGHCHTRSRREQYVAELKKYLPVDAYGQCGSLECGPKSVMGGKCWEQVLQPNYSFYLSMENAFCDDYITEKLYNPLVHNIVPVVWGGADYSLYLPPHSYIDARHYHPRELASLLMRLHQDPVAYGRYHIWRAYLQPMLKGSLCELCHMVHTNTSRHHYTDLPDTRYRRGRCDSLPSSLFGSPRPDSWKKVITTNYSETDPGKSIS